MRFEQEMIFSMSPRNVFGYLTKHTIDFNIPDLRTSERMLANRNRLMELVARTSYLSTLEATGEQIKIGIKDKQASDDMDVRMEIVNLLNKAVSFQYKALSRMITVRDYAMKEAKYLTLPAPTFEYTTVLDKEDPMRVKYNVLKDMAADEMIDLLGRTFLHIIDNVQLDDSSSMLDCIAKLTIAYVHLTVFLAYIKVDIREKSCFGNSKDYQDMCARKNGIYKLIKVIEIQYDALSRSITIKSQLLNDLFYKDYR